MDRPVAEVIATPEGFAGVHDETRATIGTSGDKDALIQELIANGYDIKPVAVADTTNVTVSKRK